MNIDPVSENFILYAISDDWSEIGVFVDHVKKFYAEKSSDPEFLLSLVRELGARGYLEFGWLPTGEAEWDPWDTPIGESIDRIAYGFGGRPGFLSMDESDVRSTETVRVCLTKLGRDRLEALGDPYEKYGDPWYDDPYLNSADWGYPPYDPTVQGE